jgi:hypothetical protein
MKFVVQGIEYCYKLENLLYILDFLYYFDDGKRYDCEYLTSIKSNDKIMQIREMYEDDRTVIVNELAINKRIIKDDVETILFKNGEFLQLKL